MFCVSIKTFAQQSDAFCGFHSINDTVNPAIFPWFGNNLFLQSFKDSIVSFYDSVSAEREKKFEGGFDDKAFFWIPIKVWVYNDNNGIGGIPEEEVRQSIRNLNNQFKGLKSNYQQSHSHTGIQFYIKCEITYINSTAAAFSMDVNTALHFSNNFELGVLNLHIVQNATDYKGAAYLPFQTISTPFSAVVRTSDNSHLNSVLFHEIGHSLGLYHTHEFIPPDTNVWAYQRDAPPCFQESVSRQRLQDASCENFPTVLKCEKTGDFLCDTEADPGLHGHGMVSGTTYTGGGHDHWGDAWAPNVFNIMSYAPQEIINFFSEGQIGVMQFWTTGGDSRLQQSKRIHHQNNFIDIYEPDDVFSDASEIVLNGIPQTRGLHGIPNGPLNSPSFDYCNKDWVKFTLSETKKVSIRTQQIQSGMDEVNTSIELFGSDATTSLAFNNDINPDDFYSVILDVTLQPGDYYILIRNEGLSSGIYTLALEDCGIEGCCFQPLLTKTTTVTHGVNSPFNIGHKAASYEKIDRDIEVSNNLSGQEGVLGCNISSPIGNGHLPNSSLGSPTPNSHLFVDVCNYAEVSIDHSIFIIGDSDSNLSSVVSFKEGTTLKLMSFGKLRISNNSKLIIEDGANFIFEEGAEIELLGPNSSLEIRGKLTIGNNADFTFTGDGRLVFDQDIKWATNSFGNPYLKLDEYMEIGADATFKVEGPSFNNMSHVLIEARKPVYFRTEDGAAFKEVSIKYGRVALHQDALLFSFSPTTIMWVHFDAVNPSQKHGGFRLWHNAGPNHILRSKFSNGNFGALIHWFGGGNPITISHCDFYDNAEGLNILGGNFNLNNSNFNNNLAALSAPTSPELVQSIPVNLLATSNCHS